MVASNRGRGVRNFGPLLALCLVFLAGCAATPRFTETLQSWLGRTDTELLAAYGTAPSVYELDERTKILTWSATRFKPVDPLSHTTKLNSPSETLTSYSRRCAVSFTVVDGAIKKWNWRGNNHHLCPMPGPPES